MTRWAMGWVLMVGLVFADGQADEIYKQGAVVYQTEPAKAYELFVQAAERGHASALAGAGYCCETGTGTKVDYAKAIAFYEKAVEQNSLKACEGLARIYASCEDPQFHDGEKAVKFASAFVRKKPNDAEALSLLSLAHNRNVEFDKAVRTGKKAVLNCRDIERAKELNVTLDDLEAKRPIPQVANDVWIFRASEKDSVWAIKKVVDMYAKKGGDAYNSSLAFKYCKRGVELGEVSFYPLLGDLYYEKGETEENLNQAYNCYELAIEHKCYQKKSMPYQVLHRKYFKEKKDACFEEAEKCRTGYERKESYISGYSTETYSDGYYTYTRLVPEYSTRIVRVPPDPTKARFLYKIAQIKGHPQAEEMMAQVRGSTQPSPVRTTTRSSGSEGNSDFQLGMKYYRGDDGCEKDLTKAREYFEKAAAVGHADAYYNLARMYESGRGVEKDKAKAIELYEKAYGVRNFHAYAYALGCAYLGPKNPEWNVSKAIEWLEKAIANGSTTAHWRLAELYACGRDEVDRNGALALKHAKEYVKANPDSFSAYKTLSHAYARDGQFEEAEKKMSKAISMLRRTNYYDQFIDQYNERLDLFKQGKPFPPDE